MSKVRNWMAGFETMAKALNWTDTKKLERVRRYLDGPAYSWYVLNMSENLNPPKTFEAFKDDSKMIRS